MATINLDESIFPPRMIDMARAAYLSTHRDVYINSQFHKRQILFIPIGNNIIYCRYCSNLLFYYTDTNHYIQPFHIACCKRCKKEWQLAFFDI